MVGDESSVQVMVRFAIVASLSVTEKPIVVVAWFESEGGCVLIKIIGAARSFTLMPELNVSNCESAVVTVTAIKPKAAVVVREQVAEVVEVTLTVAQVKLPTVTVIGERKPVPVRVSVVVDPGSTIVGETPVIVGGA